MSEPAEQLSVLEQDAELASALRRVSYHTGMMLGLDAARDEQAYHRRSLNRNRYWLHGAGTLVGMAVAVDPASSEVADPILTRITVSPGLGVDCLGREVMISEDHCIDLGDWLKAQSETLLRDGYDEDNDLLWLNVTVRYQPCEVAKQPVLARKLNLSTDAVQASRIADSILLELVPQLPPETSEEGYKPWSAHDAVEETPTTLTPTEQNYLDDVNATNAQAGEQLSLHARLLNGLSGAGLDVQVTADQLEAGARLLLARLSISMASLTPILEADENAQVVNPNDITVNNLVRPFLVTPSQLAYLHRQSGV